VKNNVQVVSGFALSTNTVIIVAAAGGGGLLILVIVIILLAVFLVRRRKKQPKAQVTEMKKVEENVPEKKAEFPTGYEEYHKTPSDISQHTYVPMSTVGAQQPLDQELLKTLEKRHTSKYHIRYGDLQIEAQLGEGAFGVVYKANYHLSPVAVKQLKNAGVMNPKQLDNMIKEALTMLSIQPHRNVVSFVGLCISPFCIVTEYLPGGTLQDLVTKGPIDFKLKIKMLSDVAVGMLHLSSQMVVHKDLAARNVLLDLQFNAKIADFGLSRFTDSDALFSKSEVGPLRWMAPECFTDKKFSEYSDVWSFGIVCLETLRQEMPYADITDLAEFGFKFGRGLRPNKYIPEGPMKELLVSCFRENPEERPLFRQICRVMSTIN